MAVLVVTAIVVVVVPVIAAAVVIMTTFQKIFTQLLTLDTWPYKRIRFNSDMSVYSISCAW